MSLRSHCRRVSVGSFLSFMIAATAWWLPGDVGATIVKSPNDKRQYESLLLPNKLKVLIVSDPDTDKAAAAMDVLVGSGSDEAARVGPGRRLVDGRSCWGTRPPEMLSASNVKSEDMGRN